MFFDYQLNVARNAGGLAIKTTSSALAKTVNAITATINSVKTAVAAGDVALTNSTYEDANGNLKTTTWTLADGYSVAVSVFSNGTAFAVSKGTTKLTTAGINLATDLDLSLMGRGYALVGIIFIANGTGSTFTAGTTALDTASLTVTYLDQYMSVGV